jgi:hypothetical protein
MTQLLDKIGFIKLIQVQRSPLKIDQPRRYNPGPLLAVEQLLLSSQGVVGVVGHNRFIDVHHAEHPNSRYHGSNGVSIGFTSHYRQIRDKFGEHINDGCAGENILVETAQSFSLADLGEQLIIQNPKTGALVYLTALQVAAPCVEFSHYVANQVDPLPPAEIKTILQFLDNGRRGFYTTLAAAGLPALIQVGDIVWRGEAAR